MLIVPQYVNQDEVEERAKKMANKMTDERIEQLTGNQRPDSEWHLDKRLPIAIIFAIAVQTIGIVTFAASWKAAFRLALSKR